MKDWIIKYWLEAIFGVIISILTWAFNKLKKNYQQQSKEQAALKEGMQAILRKSIIDDYNHYMERGWIPIYAMENVLSMFISYEDLGGKGTVKDLVEDLKELRHTSPKRT